jgi:hypothetical protein
MSESELVDRLERLERAHRRLKGFALAALVLATALTMIYATQPAPQTITAHEFNVVDSSGKVRVRVSMECSSTTECEPTIRLFDKDQSARTTIREGGVTIGGGGIVALLLANELEFIHGDNITAQFMGDLLPGGPSLTLSGKGGNFVDVNSSPPSIEIQDSKGFTMALGTVDLTTPRTGGTRQTSAASIVLSDKDGNVLWSAP